MNDNRTAAAPRSTQEREEAIKVGARALIRKLNGLEARARLLRRAELDKPGSVDALEELAEDLYQVRWELYELTAGAIGWDYTASDVELWCKRVTDAGRSHPRLDHALLLDLIHGRKLPEDLVVEGEGLRHVAT